MAVAAVAVVAVMPRTRTPTTTSLARVQRAPASTYDAHPFPIGITPKERYRGRRNIPRVDRGVCLGAPWRESWIPVSIMVGE